MQARGIFPGTKRVSLLLPAQYIFNGWSHEQGKGRRKWQPTPGSLPGESHGWRNLVGYSPRVTESDTTERLRFRMNKGRAFLRELWF